MKQDVVLCLFSHQVEGATAAALETGKQSWKEDSVLGSSAMLFLSGRPGKWCHTVVT